MAADPKTPRLFGRRIYAKRHKVFIRLINQRASLVHLILMKLPTDTVLELKVLQALDLLVKPMLSFQSRAWL
jgi:hypothetical protein